MGLLRNGLLVVAAVGVVALIFAPGAVESDLNRKADVVLPPLSQEARNQHATLRVADLHADTLLWLRDPLSRSNRGHTDIPRLQEGNVAVQVFAAVTKSPRSQNYESNEGDSDNITGLAMVQRWPIRTWDSLLERALYQAQRLRDAAGNSANVNVISNQSELADHLANWSSGGPVGGILALEGAHPLEQDLANLQRLFDAGYRMIGLQHFFDNALGGSLHGQEKGGLTDFGRQVVEAADKLGFILDVAHSSAATVDDVLALTRQPVVVSHTGLQGACDSPRNLADSQLRAIADRGGLIGIGFWDAAVCDISPAGVATSIVYALEHLGESAVALGSDYDGATEVAFDASELAHLTQALLEAGLTDRQIRLVMGENQLRFLSVHLPE